MRVVGGIPGYPPLAQRPFSCEAQSYQKRVRRLVNRVHFRLEPAQAQRRETVRDESCKRLAHQAMLPVLASQYISKLGTLARFIVPKQQHAADHGAALGEFDYELLSRPGLSERGHPREPSFAVLDRLPGVVGKKAGYGRIAIDRQQILEIILVDWTDGETSRGDWLGRWQGHGAQLFVVRRGITKLRALRLVMVDP